MRGGFIIRLEFFRKFIGFGSVTHPLFSLEKTYLVLYMETYCSGIVTSLQGCLDVLFHNLCCLFSVLVRYILGESISYHVVTYVVDCLDSTVP